MKTFLISLLAVLCFTQLFSQQLQAFNIKDTVVTTTECYLYDPGGFKMGYAAGTTVITFYSASGSTLGISFDSVQLNANDMITVYDGNSVNSPWLAVSTGDLRHVKSTGSSLTVKFIASSAISSSKYGWAAHVRSLINNPVPAQFTSIFIGLNDVNFDLADYDHDGDMDVLNRGRVFRNDTQDDSLYRFAVPSFSPVGDWKYAASAVADFDGDGFKDVFMTGQLLNGTLTATLYLNNRNGGFTLSSQSFPGVFRGRCKVVDYNYDGKPDISYIGATDEGEKTFIFKLYINNGNGTFSEKVTNVTGLYNSSLSWADTDNDGDLDLVINGQEAKFTAYARLLINNNNTFTEKSIGLTQITDGEISFADINNDGRPDIINTGVKLNSTTVQMPVTELFVNTGNNDFTALTHNLPSSKQGYTDWADYDNDGDVDLLISGTSFNSTTHYAASIYKNNGNGNFTRIDITNGPYMSSNNPVRWIDFNHDGKLDVFVCNVEDFSYIAKNLGNDQFTIVTYPLPIFSTNMGAVEITDFDNDGAIDILFAGSIWDNCTITPGSRLFKAQGWSKEKAVVRFTPAVDLKIRPDNPDFLPAPFCKWADFDNDNLIDITVVDTAGSTLRIYKNQGNNIFSKVYDGNPGGSKVRKAEFIDLDNDGKRELVVAPNSVYKWNGASFDVVYQDATYCCENLNMQFADYNNDGYPDMALSIVSNDNLSRPVRIYKNDKTGKLVEVKLNLNNISYSTGFIRWLDMDNDGDLDLALVYAMLENINGENFIIRETGNANYAQAAIGDLNGDGFADIFGFQAPYGSETRNYYGQGPFFFQESPPSLTFYGRSSDAQVVDIDQDGDLDIIQMTGSCGYELMLNNSNSMPKHLELINPANSEQLKAGSTYPIRWKGNQLPAAVALLYSTDNGKTYTPIKTLVPSDASGGSYNWTVPYVGSSDSCLVKITDQQAVSTSSSVFSIIYTLPKPQLNIAAAYCKKGVQYVDLFNPPPAKENVTIFAILNAATLPVTAGKVQLKLDTLAPGDHVLTVVYNRNSELTTTTYSFKVLTLSTPQVGLQTNITNITNLSAPVVVTATNKQGGGMSPLYAFADDRLFTNILQQESTNTTLSINPPSLHLGDNKIYVRMKTSDTCYSDQTAIDSLVLIREVSTGIIDPNDPLYAINMYPNPFDHNIVVYGLNRSKTYFITIVNSTGRVVYRSRISNTSSENISGLNLPRGLYWISLYEGKQKRKLGTVKMTRLR